MDLSKSDKKVARQIIEKGLQQEFADGLAQFDSILTEWKEMRVNNQEAYYAIYNRVVDFDKRIAQRYDRMSGSRYLFIVSAQFRDGLISVEDLESFSEEARSFLERMTKLM